MGCQVSSDESGSESEASSAGGLLNINHASVEELMGLAGIGRSRAEQLVAYRERHGDFASAAQLEAVPGIGRATARKLAAQVCFEDETSWKLCGLMAGCLGLCCHCPRLLWGLGEEALFFPDDVAKTGLGRLLGLLDGARKQLDVAVFSISHKDLADALLKAHRRGVAVRVLTDDVQARQENSKVPELQRELPLRMDSNEKLHMHHKFVVIDGTTVLSGSLNWTHAAVEKGNENLVISENSYLCRTFSEEFERLWRLFGGASVPEVHAAGDGEVAALFFPEPSMSNVGLILAELKKASRSIDIAVFTLTLDSLVEVLLEKHKAGLRVRVITDNRQANVPGADAQRMARQGVPVKVDRSWYAMHHKFAVIDGRCLINGSFNWTAQATKGNQEDAVIFRQHVNLAQEFAAEFDRLWDSFEKV